jgi:hypothetical protein
METNIREEQQMNPLPSEFHEGSGDAWGLVVLVTWFLGVVALSKAFDYLNISENWRININIAIHAAVPLWVMYAYITHDRPASDYIPATIGIAVVMFISFAVTSSIIGTTSDSKGNRS